MPPSDNAQKTEKPTPRKLREARRKGQIPRSPDLVGWLVLLVLSFVLPLLARRIHGAFVRYFDVATEAVVVGDETRAMTESMAIAGRLTLILLPFLGLAALLSAVLMAVQGGVTLTFEPLRPKLERISPQVGLKRLFSAQSAVDTAKALVRLVALGLLVVLVARTQVAALLTSTSRALAPAGADVAGGLLLLIRLGAIVGVVVGAADYAFQRRKIGKQLRMSKHEVKQENRNTEGDPLTKSRRRAQHAKVSRNQMLAAVNDASVVVVNPTHVAVALSYDAGQVPTVVAKGGDELAMRIRERAFAGNVPVIEARPLARILHDTMDVGEEIPAHLYEAVAIVIAFVMRSAPNPFAGLVRRVDIPPSKMIEALARQAEHDGADEAIR